MPTRNIRKTRRSTPQNRCSTITHSTDQTDMSKMTTKLQVALILHDASSGSEFYRDRVKKVPTSGWGSFWERYSFVFWFSPLEFCDVSRKDPECTRTCGLRRNSSNLKRAPRIRLSVPLNSWDTFFVTLPPISSDSWVIYSSWIPAINVFRDWLLLEPSLWLFLMMAASFHLCLSVAIPKEK